MTLHSVLINANAIICLMLALRLMFFQKTGRYRFFHLTNCLPRDSVCCVDSPTNFFTGNIRRLIPQSSFSTSPSVLLSGGHEGIFQK